MSIFNKIAKAVPDSLLEKAVEAVVSNVGKVKEMDSSTQKKNLPKCNQTSGWSDDLEDMVKMMIEDDTLSDKNISLLKKRAEKEGFDPEEFEFDLQLRIRQYKREIELRANLNPVEALSQTLKTLENHAAEGSKKVDIGAYSKVLEFIPGLNEVASIDSAIADFFTEETPSNLNQLKAETIRQFALPEREDYLRDFIQYAGSQLEEETTKNKYLIKGDELTICFTWLNKIEDACNLSLLRFSDNPELMATVKRYRPTLSYKLRKGLIHSFSGLPTPTDDEDLLNAIAFFYEKRNDEYYWSKVKDVYKRFYKDAEVRFSSKPELNKQLRNYKLKLFGLF